MINTPPQAMRTPNPPAKQPAQSQGRQPPKSRNAPDIPCETREGQRAATKPAAKMPRGRSVQRSMRSRRSLEKRVVRNAMASPMNAPDAMGTSVVNSTIGQLQESKVHGRTSSWAHLRAKGPTVVFDGPPSYGAAPSSAPCAPHRSATRIPTAAAPSRPVASIARSRRPKRAARHHSNVARHQNAPPPRTVRPRSENASLRSAPARQSLVC